MLGFNWIFLAATLQDCTWVRDVYVPRHVSRFYFDHVIMERAAHLRRQGVRNPVF